jgi:hypothetical protein
MEKGIIEYVWHGGKNPRNAKGSKGWVEKENLKYTKTKI